MKIDLFRAGAQTAMSGKRIEFSDADIAAIALAYDPQVHEAPLVAGHPSHDAPAYGWVTGLQADGGKLTAQAGQVDPAFGELIEKGRYKKVSASFYSPDSPANPTPGVYHLRHVGFLGAQAPAVKGLSPVEFADGDEGTETIEFADQATASFLYNTASAWRGLREWIIGKFGQEEADKVAPSYIVDGMQAQAARMQDAVSEGAAPAFSEGEPEPIVPVMAAVDPAAGTPLEVAPAPPAQDPAESVEPPAETAPEALPALQPDAAAAAFAEREQQLAADQARLAQERADFAEQAVAARRLVAAHDVATLVTAGKLAPGYSADFAELLEHLDGGGVVSFGEGDDAETPRARLLRLANAGRAVIDFGEAAPDARAPAPTGDAVAHRARRINEVRDEAAKAGRTISFAEASTKVDQEEIR